MDDVFGDDSGGFVTAFAKLCMALRASGSLGPRASTRFEDKCTLVRSKL